MFTFLKNVINSIFFSTKKKTEEEIQAPYKVEVPPVVPAPTENINQVSVKMEESVSISVSPVEPVELKPVEVKTEIKSEEKPKRARDQKGRMKADDKNTEIVNEAWVGGKAPAKKSKPAKTVKANATEKTATKSESKQKKMRVVNVNK